MIVAVAVGWLVWTASLRLGAHRPVAVAAASALTVREPLVGLAAFAAWAARRRWLRAALRSSAERDETGDVVVLADLLVLALTAGLSLRASFETARRHLGPGLASRVEDLLADMDRVGVAPALSSTEGSLADICRVAAGAAASGAPVAAAIAGFATTRRHMDHAERSAAARRLPVRLLLPLALLILPGFVVLAVGPALLQALARLGPVP